MPIPRAVDERNIHCDFQVVEYNLGSYDASRLAYALSREEILEAPVTLAWFDRPMSRER